MFDCEFVAAVDCTGHGVPGAFMSIIGFDLLRNITKEQGVNNPSEILNRLNKGVSDTFSKNVDENDVKDGMDLSLVVIDKNNKDDWSLIMSTWGKKNQGQVDF